MAGKDSEVRSRCRQMVAANAPEITQKLIEKALEGSHQHAKFLFDFAFAEAAKGKDDEDELPGPSLAEILLERLREFEEEAGLEECASA